MFYSDPAGKIRLVAEERLWFSSAALTEADESLGRLYASKLFGTEEKQQIAYSDTPDLEQEERVRLWRACVHSPWAALSRRELDPAGAAYAAAAATPGCLVFNTTCATLRLAMAAKATTG